jgi:hypothetical protein
MSVFCVCNTVRTKGTARTIRTKHRYRWSTENKKKSPMVSLGIFSEAADETMCSGVDSASKNKSRKTPGGEGGRCVRVTTYHLHSAECRDDPGTLSSWNPKSHIRLVVENLYLLTWNRWRNLDETLWKNWCKSFTKCLSYMALNTKL